MPPIAEAFVLIRPDLSVFAAELEKEILAITSTAGGKPISIPVTLSAGSIDMRGIEQAAEAASRAGAVSATASQADAAAKRLREQEDRKAGEASKALSAFDRAEAATAQDLVAAQRLLNAAKAEGIHLDDAVAATKRASISALKAEAAAIAAGASQQERFRAASDVALASNLEQQTQALVAARAGAQAAEASQADAAAKRAQESSSRGAIAASRELEAVTRAEALTAERLVSAQTLLNAATAGGIDAEQALGAARRASAAALQQELTAVSVGTQQTRFRAQSNIELARSLELQAEALVQADVATRALAEAQAIQITETATLRDVQTAASTSATALAEVQEALDLATRAGNEGLVERLTLLQAEALAQDEAAASALAAGREREAINRLVIRSETALERLDKIRVADLSAVTKQQLSAAAAGQAFRASQEALARAVELGDAALAEQIGLLHANTTEQLKNAQAQAASARSFGQAARGAGSSALSFLGLRGATLAASGSFIAAAASFLVLAKAIGSAARLEEELNVFQETTGATADEMARVSEAAKEMGADLTLPGVSAGDAAEAMTELAKAGLSVTDSIEGARGTLQLATAAQISNAEASELAANSLNAFGLAGEEAVHVADLLANAANAAQGSIADFGAAQSQVNAVARQVGISLEDTIGLLTLFARNGLRGSDAGTSLRTALVRLIAPTKEARQEIATLGLQIRDAEGNVRPDIFAQFGEATKDLSPSLRDAAAALIFGQDAIRAVAIGAREGASGLADIRTEMERTGSAADLAAARSKGLAGAARGLGSELDTLGTTLGGTITPALTGTVNLLSEFVGGINDAGSAIDDFLASLGEQALKISDFFSFIPGLPTLRELFSSDDARIQIDQLQAALDAFGISAEDQSKAISKFFQPELEGASRLKTQLTELGIPTEKVTELFQELQAAKDLALQGVHLTPEQILPGALEQALTNARNLLKGLQEAGAANQTVQKLKDQIKELEDEVARGQGAIGRLATEGVPDGVIRPLDEMSGKVRALLTQLQADAKNLDPANPLAAAARESVEATIAELEQLGPKGAAALREAGPQLAAAFAEDLRSAVSEFTGIDSLVKDEVPADIEAGIKRLRALGPAGAAELKKLGQDLTAGLAEGLADETAAVAAARQTLNDAISAAKDAVAEAVRSAEGNLEGLGDSLADQVAQAIEQGPSAGIRGIAEQIAQAQGFKIDVDAIDAIKNVDDLREALQKLQDQRQRQGLQRGVDDALRELNEAKASIVTFGRITPDQQAAIDEFLRPFEEKFQDAQAAAQEFDLNEQIDQVEETKQKAADAAKEGIAKLVGQFEDGKISADEFAKELRQQVQPALDALPKANLGFNFTRDFMRNLNTVVQQAHDLVGFLDRAEAGPQSVDVGAAAGAANRRITDARTALNQARDELTKQTTKQQTMVDLLKDIKANTKRRPGRPRVVNRNTVGPNPPEQDALANHQVGGN